MKTFYLVRWSYAHALMKTSENEGTRWHPQTQPRFHRSSTRMRVTLDTGILDADDARVYTRADQAKKLLVPRACATGSSSSALTSFLKYSTIIIDEVLLLVVFDASTCSLHWFGSDNEEGCTVSAIKHRLSPAGLYYANVQAVVFVIQQLKYQNNWEALAVLDLTNEPRADHSRLASRLQHLIYFWIGDSLSIKWFFSHSIHLIIQCKRLVKKWRAFHRSFVEFEGQWIR